MDAGLPFGPDVAETILADVDRLLDRIDALGVPLTASVESVAAELGEDGPLVLGHLVTLSRFAVRMISTMTVLEQMLIRMRDVAGGLAGPVVAPAESVEAVAV